MAASASCNLFSLKTLPKIATIRPKTTNASPRLRPAKNGAPLLRAHQPSLVVRAVDATNGVSVVEKEAAAAVEEAVAEIGGLKKKLVDTLSGTRMGLKASSESTAEILELVSQLEAGNPMEEHSLLDGKWFLVYTSLHLHSHLPPIVGPISSQLMEMLKADEISQTIDTNAFSVGNAMTLVGPFASTTFTAIAKYEVLSTNNVQIKFVEGVLGPLQLTDHIEIPEKLELFGHHIDLSPLKGVITPIKDAYSKVAKTISGQPPIKIPISDNNAKSWLLTYFDGEVRISKGSDGSVFVFVKEGSSLLTNFGL